MRKQGMAKLWFPGVLFACSHAVEAASQTPSPIDLSLQELLDIEVTTVSRQAESLSSAAAAIYVITGEEIRQRGFQSIPQALRDVPGLHVAQIDAQKWAVSSRGFNGRFNNKMLVLIDGRSVYSPEFSGVYWEVQDTLMADIERIEVIRGPGAAIWGANAVNGVINIISRHSADTQGGYAEIGAGDYQQAFAGFRYGGRLAPGLTGRAYVKAFKRDDLAFDPADVNPSTAALISQTETDNSWWKQQAGARLDMTLGTTATLRLSGAAYDSMMDQTVTIPTLTDPYIDYPNISSVSRGWHLLGDYTRALSADSQLNLKVYFDHAKRDESLFGYSRDTLDVEMSHHFEIGARHELLWGMGYRHIDNELDTNMSVIDTRGDNESTNLWSLFVQDQITLKPEMLWLTLATRFEHHAYSDFEWQPTVRLSWQPAERHRFWTAVSRAVRTPSQLEHEYFINAGNLAPLSAFNPTGFVNRLILQGNSDFDSEVVKSIEAGYRYASQHAFSLDTAVFYNDYDDLRSNQVTETDFSTLPAYITTFSAFDNDASGKNYGLELSANWMINQRLKLRLNYSYIESDFSEGQPQNTDAPEQLVSLFANWRISDDIDLTATWRYVDRNQSIDPVQVDNQTIDAYHGVDLGLNWQLTPDLQLSVFARDLFYGSHVEYKAELLSIPYRVEPSFYGRLTLEY
ncbi:TonB-dependent receptor plug domain-containing protein [Methylophaga sp. OBS1]|uniref:TonB-dependent receptor plug domain-containing protein n=1 Tax=Methylophaga sp. OBS1 TaxID=2991933 RepID=UPI00224F1C3D|nr:TonB-dependent receptor [Methylophaga sp. OBS1]MCX4190869.1 TonB-dependent receptor [Methylophaga sp. OBS1]MCX4192184.1 TonB-dependent receptor [Methylophaga sp. OBS1]